MRYRDLQRTFIRRVGSARYLELGEGLLPFLLKLFVTTPRFNRHIDTRIRFGQLPREAGESFASSDELGKRFRTLRGGHGAETITEA